jgi:ABC-2 type transport system ATP-binding protein
MRGEFPPSAANTGQVPDVYAGVSDPAVIAASGLAKEYRHWGRAVRALDGVDLEVGRGEVFGLLGANGAGKTTLMKILLGLTAPTAGSVLLRGRDPRVAATRRRVGYLPEGHRFPAYLTGESAVRLFGRLAGVGEAVLDRRIPMLLELVGLAGRGGDRIGRYSKGMTQRLGLASALVDEPDVLFLDEPTDGVDPVGRRHIRDVLLEARGHGTTIFINSHLLSEVERTCDRVCIIHAGRVVRTGRVADLTRPGRRFTVRFAGGPPADLDRLRVAGASVAAVDGHLDVAVETLEALNALIDRARAERLLIAEVAPSRSDLEDVFIDIVSGQPADEHPTEPRPTDHEPRAGGGQ